MARYNNIFLTDTGEAHDFTSAPKLGGAAEIPQRQNRQEHSDKLIAQFRDAQNQFRTYTPEQVAAIAYNTGTYVEFSGAENFDLITKSLEDVRQGIRLLNVRDVVIENVDGTNTTTTRATVFIPTGKEDVFIKKISDFATELTRFDKPKNDALVRSIESISTAIKISAFWVGRPSDMPGDEKNWYELWIDAPDNNFNQIEADVFALFESLRLEHRPKREIIHFHERLVVPVCANRVNLLDIIKQGVTVAEIRKPADPNAYFLDSSMSEQTDWADNLLARTHFNNTGVAVCILDTGVNRHHALIEPYMPSEGLTIERIWGIDDRDGHGTNMAGVVLYDDLRRYLISNEPYNLNHAVESVKILGTTANKPELYGAVTTQAVLLPEIESPTTKRVYCMAVTAPTSFPNDGQPSSWSGAIDQISSDDEKRLFIVSAGNVQMVDLQASGYPDACLKKPVEDPAQAWNAISVGAYSVGAYSLDVDVNATDATKGYYAVAKTDELSPYSSTSNSWQSQWPIKPELVCDGGNVASDGTNFMGGHDDLSKLTLHKDISRRLFDTIWATSAATAQCSYIAAELLASYPSMNLETVRALLVHSARWTDAMKNQFGYPDTKTQGRSKLLRTCGYGVPDLWRAKDTLNNRVNMIIESEIQPYEKVGGATPKMREMHLHTLPWPNSVLQSLENTLVNVRVTLSYFIEPGPGQKGWKNKYRYASCGLRFEMKRPNETEEQFRQRINKAMRDDDYQSGNAPDSKWFLGENNRNVGSVHSDVWEDTAINLADSGFIAIFPVVGWWRERTNLKKYNSKIRYSLVVSLETPSEDIDLYTPITTKIAARIAIPITT